MAIVTEYLTLIIGCHFQIETFQFLIFLYHVWAQWYLQLKFYSKSPETWIGILYKSTYSCSHYENFWHTCCPAVYAPWSVCTVIWNTQSLISNIITYCTRHLLLMSQKTSVPQIHLSILVINILLIRLLQV